MMKASFRDEGIAKADRLRSGPGSVRMFVRRRRRPPEVAKRVEAEALASIRWPAGGQYFGDWVAGEKLAQSGRGMTWYRRERRHRGQRGPVLQLPPARQEGDLARHDRPEPLQLRQEPGREERDRPVVGGRSSSTPRGKLWNSKAYAACSNMPRFGHMQLLERGADPRRHGRCCWTRARPSTTRIRPSVRMRAPAGPAPWSRLPAPHAPTESARAPHPRRTVTLRQPPCTQPERVSPHPFDSPRRCTVNRREFMIVLPAAAISAAAPDPALAAVVGDRVEWRDIALLDGRYAARVAPRRPPGGGRALGVVVPVLQEPEPAPRGAVARPRRPWPRVHHVLDRQGSGEGTRVHGEARLHVSGRDG